MRLVKTDINYCHNCKKQLLNKRADALWCSNKCGQQVRRKRHYQSNPEYYKEKRKRESSDWQRRIYSRIKSRAKKNNIDFDLIPSDLDCPTHCPVLGIPILKVTGANGFHPQSISVDRIDNSKGYIRGNIQIISGRANVMKSDADPEMLITFSKWVRRVYES